MNVAKCSSLCFFVSLFLCFSANADPRIWGEHGIPVRQGMHLKWYQGMARDDYGNTLLVWSEKSTGQRDVRAQLINSSGQPQWAPGGVNITPEVHFQDRPIAVAVDGGWIIAWVDFRDTVGCDYYWDYYTCSSVFAQKLDYFGNRLWPDNDFTGAMVNPSVDGFDKFSLRMVSDAAGGALIAWSEYGTEGSPYRAQRINGNGDVAWPEPAQIVDSNYMSDVKVAPGSDGSMFIAWGNYGATGVGVARILPDGTLPWGPNGVHVTGDWYVMQTGVVSDGADGCFVVWADGRNGSPYRIYAQHLAGDGQPSWAENGIPLSADGHETISPTLALSMTGGESDGIVTVWTQQEQENQYAVYVQKISPEGIATWADGGLTLSGLQAYDWVASSTVTTDYNGGLVALWQDNSGEVPHCYATRVRDNGTQAWGSNPVLVGEVRAPSANSYPTYGTPLFGMAGNFGTYFVAYVGVDSTGMEGVRYQLLDHANGTRLLGTDGIAAVSGVGGEADYAHLAPMGNHRTVVLWSDGRSGYGSAWSSPLYYQIVGPDGQVERAANGERLVHNSAGSLYMAQSGPQTCEDGAGGVFVSYVDYRAGSSRIRVSHLSSSGDVVGPDSGMVVWQEPGLLDQYYGFICSDGMDGCYVAWTGYDEHYSEDAYVMRLNPDLQRVWNEPVQLTDTVTQGSLGALVAGSPGGCIAVLTFGLYSNLDIRAAGISDDGTVAWDTTICEAPGSQSNLVAIADGVGGAYVVWEDARASQTERDLYAQRVAGDGTVLWATNGVPVYAGTGTQSDPQATLDSGGNLCVVWADERSGLYQTRVYSQRLTPLGTRLWNQDGVRVNNTHSYWPQVTASSREGIFAFWGSYESGVFAMHLDSTGAVFDDQFWRPDTGGVVAEPTDVRDLVYGSLAVSDGWGGCVAGWTKYEDEYEFYPDRGGELYTADIFVQRIFDYATSARQPDDYLPREYALYQNYPNPFNPVTVIRFDLPQATDVKMRVYDLLGREVQTLIHERLSAGEHQMAFDASALPSGIYFYRLQAGAYTATKKLVVLK